MWMVWLWHFSWLRELGGCKEYILMLLVWLWDCSLLHSENICLALLRHLAANHDG